VGAGPLPRADLTEHPPRPPIPIVALDEAAMAAARERGGDELAVWLAGVTAAGSAVTVRRIDAASALVGRDPPLAVAEVAHAVDAGRDLAARAAAEGVSVAIGAGGGSQAARSLITALAGDDGRPLRALRRLGTEEIAVLCGVALGAGERGLGCVCEGLAALAGAAVAAAIEPDLRPRLRAATDQELAALLGIEPIDARLLR
jgi:nicotinate-nucleotide--dimethylbenzimidazole phosphoribosyltransferase